MPRPKKPGAPEPKRRSRTGCWQCKGRKVKCGEERPSCVNCQKAGHQCDYSIRLNWDGRRTKRASYDGTGDGQLSSPTRSQRPFTIIHQTYTATPAPLVPLPLQRRLSGETWLEPQGPSNQIHAHDIGDAAREQTPASPSNQVFPERDSIQLSPESTGHGSNDATQEQEELLRALLNPGPRREEPPPFIHRQFPLIPDTSMAQPSPPRDYDHTHSLFRQPQEPTATMLDTFGPTTALHSAGRVVSPTGEDSGTPLFLRFHPLASLSALASPPTPMTPSSYSDDDPRAFGTMAAQSTHSNPASPDTRRLTVNSLLSGPPGPIYHSSDGGLIHNGASPAFGATFDYDLDLSEDARFYGYDLGKRDEDVPKNDDRNAIASSPPTPQTPHDHAHDMAHGATADDFSIDGRFGDRLSGRSSATSGNYYKDPVAIKIPYNLEPLPSKLLENPMNLLYFHHFLNHTARVLMPYDDQQSNPFRIILPQMAVKNDHLLSLLLAYSASHRARLLHQKEPGVRMAQWVQDIFPALREALSDNARVISNTSLATAIMLASLEIISPKAFGYAIPWQEHLNLARDLMRKRFSGLAAPKISHSSSREDQVCSFLWSWFAYLDVLGGLSGGPRKSDSSPTLPLEYTDDPDEIDCITGFTTRCVRLLAQTADLARLVDSQRIRNGAFVDPNWLPDREILERALLLDDALRSSVAREAHPCKHIRPENVDGRDRDEMRATNEAFHWAGIVQLHRRALGMSSSHPNVRQAVENIMACLLRIRKGGTAEVGILFPMFTAGCETQDQHHRDHILERFRTVEKNGMTQIRRARELMVKVWREKRPWETMMENEFIG